MISRELKRRKGSRGTRYTPCSSYRWGRDVAVGERIAMELKLARQTDLLAKVLA